MLLDVDSAVASRHAACRRHDRTMELQVNQDAAEVPPGNESSKSQNGSSISRMIRLAIAGLFAWTAFQYSCATVSESGLADGANPIVDEQPYRANQPKNRRE